MLLRLMEEPKGSMGGPRSRWENVGLALAASFAFAPVIGFYSILITLAQERRDTAHPVPMEWGPMVAILNLFSGLIVAAASLVVLIPALLLLRHYRIAFRRVVTFMFIAAAGHLVWLFLYFGR